MTVLLRWLVRIFAVLADATELFAAKVIPEVTHA